MSKISTPFDLVIIGAGPGGYTAAVVAAQKGLKVALIEKEELGGTCLNKGCIPTKALLSSVRLGEQIIQQANEFGLEIKGKVSFEGIFKKKDQIVRRLRQGLSFLLKSYNIQLIQGKAHFVSPERIRVGEAEFGFKNCIIATGSRPVSLPGLEPDGQYILTSDHLLANNEIPSSLVIIGGGVIGIEFACIFNGLGTKVTIIEALPSILPGMDREITRLLRQALERKGIKIFLGQRVTQVNKDLQGVSLSLARGQEVRAKRVLVAIGRRPYTEGLKLENAGLEMEDGHIAVNNRLETKTRNIYAIGDVIGGTLLAHKACTEATVAVQNIVGKQVVMDYRLIPLCIFSHPEVASVGLNEEEARKKGFTVKIGKFPFAANGRAMCERKGLGLVKVVGDKNSGVILGIQIIGPSATEVIATASILIKSEIKMKEIPRILFAHPTYSESIYQAILNIYNGATDLPQTPTSKS